MLSRCVVVVAAAMKYGAIRPVKHLRPAADHVYMPASETFRAGLAQAVFTASAGGHVA